MIAVGGLILAIICLATVALALGVGVATLGGREPHPLVIAVRAAAIAFAAFCLLFAALHQLAAALLR